MAGSVVPPSSLTPETAPREKLVRNGWSLYRSNPEHRKQSADRVAVSYPGYVILVVLGLAEDECMKFLVDSSMTLGALIDNAARSFQYRVPFHIVFDGTSFPRENRLADIHRRLHRDDLILYGRVVQVRNGYLSS